MYEEKEIRYKKRNKEKKESEKIKIDKEKKINTTNKKTKKKKAYVLPTILKKIDYKLLFFKLIILLLAMMLITFTIARIKKHHEKQNAILNQNINIIANATLVYFSNNTLPINIGDSTSFILEEMKNLNMISEIKDEEDKFCNYLDSFIILTKTALEEYHLKIYLKCSTNEKTSEEKIICSQNNCSIKK